MKPKNRWPNAHVRLKRLYQERVPIGMSQEEFGATYELGTQGMVWQYLSGTVPLNYDAAAKFARGLRCSIRDICPEMAESLRKEIVPMISVAFAVLLGALAAASVLLPNQAHAAVREGAVCIMLNAARRFLLRFLVGPPVPGNT